MVFRSLFTLQVRLKRQSRVQDEPIKPRWASWWHGCCGYRRLPSLLMLPTLSLWRSATSGVAGRLVALKPLWLRNDAVGVYPVLGRT